MLLKGPFDVRHQEPVVGRAVPFPEVTDLVGMGGDVAAEVAVRHQDDFLGLEGVDHPHRVGAGTADVAFGLDGGTGVDVGDDRRAGVTGLHLPQAIGGDHVGHGAAGVGTGEQHDLVRGQDGSAFGHEVDPAKDNDLALGAGGLHRKAERISR